MQLQKAPSVGEVRLEVVNIGDDESDREPLVSSFESLDGQSS